MLGSLLIEHRRAAGRCSPIAEDRAEEAGEDQELVEADIWISRHE